MRGQSARRVANGMAFWGLLRAGMGAAGLLALTAAGTASARDLVWTGQASAQWNLTDANWYVKDDPAKTPVCFESGDSAWFVDGAQKKEIVKYCVNPKFGETAWDVGAFVISNEVDELVFNSIGPNDNGVLERRHWHQSCGSLGSFEKRGAGVARFDFRLEHYVPVHVYGGTLAAANGSNWVGEWWSVFGSLHNAHDVTFHPGTTMRLDAGAIFGNVDTPTEVSLTLDGATLEFRNNAVQNFPRTCFRNAEFRYSSLPNARITFSANTEYHGTKPYCWKGTGSSSLAFGRDGNKFVDVLVDDITGDAEPDLIISNRLCDAWSDAANDKRKHRANNTFRLTGGGTMALCNRESTTTGDFQVVGATLRLGPVQNWGSDRFQTKLTSIGEVDPPQNRTIRVLDGGTVDVRDRLAQCAPQNWTLAVSNSTMRISDEIAPDVVNFAPSFGALVLHNATLDWAPPVKNWMPGHYGWLTVTERLAFSGKVYDVAPPPVNADAAFINIGFKSTDPVDDHEMPDHPGFTNVWSVLEVAVEDVTGDSATDVTIGAPIRDNVNLTYQTAGNFQSTGGYESGNPYAHWCFRGGIDKTGAGTLRLTARNEYRNATKVSGGALVVDGSIESSSGVTVDAGAFLGGTGAVAAVTLKDGAGIVCDNVPRCGDALRVASLAVEGKVSVRVRDADGLGAARFSRSLLQIADVPAAVDFTDWSVVFEGDETARAFALAYDARTGVVSARSTAGTVVIFR